MSFLVQQAALALQIGLAPGIDRLRALGTSGNLDPEMVEAVLSGAANFAGSVLAPINAIADQAGCSLVDGRVRTPSAYKTAIRDFGTQGWAGIGCDPKWGGEGLPLVIEVACAEMFYRACPAFCMLPGMGRPASTLLAIHAPDVVRDEWLPRLASGEWTATICISEADAGSDIGRLQTAATVDSEGCWRVTGEKTWISFGDHDLSGRIGHCLLARTDRDACGTAGLSLFLVPDHIDGRRNGVIVRRLEEKLGLHGSPTCALGFECAEAILLGEAGRGLQAMFPMIGVLRVYAGLQGLAIGAGALDVAMRYAFERCQGGLADRPPVPIASHADVQRMLLDMTARIEVTRGLILALAVAVDLAAHESDAVARAENAALAAWLMPLAKTLGAEAGFDVAHEAIQVLGGAGYTRDWPVEQALRDARISSIYEGASGIQALDLLHRRLWRDEARGLAAFRRAAQADIARARDALIPAASAFGEVMEELDRGANWLAGLGDTPRIAEAASYAFLQLAGLAATGWIALRLLFAQGDAPAAVAARAAGHAWLTFAPSRARAYHHEVRLGAGQLEHFADVAAAYD